MTASMFVHTVRRMARLIIILNLPFEYQLFVITSDNLIILPRAESEHEFLLKNCLYKERMLF